MTNDAAVIGAGRLGTVLARALEGAGVRIRALSCRRLESARESRRLIGGGSVFTDNVRAAEKAGLVFLCVPDASLAGVAAELASSGSNWESRYVFHCSGLLPASVLLPLEERGAFTGSFHPVQTIAAKEQEPECLSGITFGVQGCPEAEAAAAELALRLGSRHVVLKPEDKPLYHAACSAASNLFAALLDTAFFLAEKAGLPAGEGREALLPLVQGTLQNVKKLGASTALTGPVVRGDLETVRAHVQALVEVPEIRTVYVSLARHALRMAAGSGALPAKKVRALERILEGR